MASVFPLAAAILGAVALATPAAAQSPAPPQTPVSTEGKPHWLSISGEARVRYETLDRQYRAGGSGGDQALTSRTLVQVQADLGHFGMDGVTLGLELSDARSGLDDAGSPMSNSLVNPLDVLQANVRFDLDGAFGQPDASLILGRQTLHLGSSRVIERTEMSNVIFSFTGAYWRSASQSGDEWHALVVVPVGRFPTERAALADNEFEADREEWGRVLAGLHYRNKDAFGSALPDTWAEAFLFRLSERDTSRVATPNRDYWSPGVRLFRAPREGRSDFDVEASWRTGTRRATDAATDTRDLDVNAWTVHAHWGWTFNSDWNWRLAVDWDYATGDENPTDGRFDQYERLFGTRRTDFGHTGIFGPLGPANINAPGARVEFAPSSRLDFRVAWKHAWLDSATDSWIDARLRDPTGASGRFIGDLIDTRTRYWLVPSKLRGEIGLSALLPGRFATSAPRAPDYDRAFYGYAALTSTF